jgi:SulP family sulfate permease
MGYLVNFLSKPVISGFTSAAAFIIIFSQIKHLFGAEIERSNKFHEMVMNVFAKLGEINAYDFAIGLVGILILVAFKKWAKKTPSILVLVVLGILATYVLKLDVYGVKILGEIPKGLPAFSIPEMSWENTFEIWPIALTLALVGYLETISIGKALEEKDGKTATIDANQELVALGAANIAGSFFQSYWATASFSRSAINNESGVRTHLAGVFAVILVVLTLLFLTPLFYYLPKAILASIIMVSVFKLIDLKYAHYLLKTRPDEYLVLLLTFLITLFVGIPQGILAGVLFALLLMVYRTSNPHFAVIGKVKNTEYYKNVKRFAEEVEIREDLLIVRFDAQLYFGNAAYFRKRMMEKIGSKGSALKGIILNAEAINYIDSSAASMLTKLIKEIHEKDIQFYLAGAIGPTRDIIFSSGIIDELRKEYLFVKTKEAVAYFDNPDKVSIMGARVAYQNKAGR